MRWIAALLIVVSLVGCKSTPIRVTAISPDTYQVTWRTEFGPDITKQQAYDHAKAHAAQEGKRLVVLAGNMSLESEVGAPHDYHTFVLTYRLVDVNDPALQTPTQPWASGAAIPVPITETDDLYTKLMKLKEMKEQGLLTDEEFQRVKDEVLKK